MRIPKTSKFVVKPQFGVLNPMSRMFIEITTGDTSEMGPDSEPQLDKL
jgi:hypothetical protein